MAGMMGPVSPPVGRRVQLLLLAGALGALVITKVVSSPSADEPDVARPPIPSVPPSGGPCTQPPAVAMPPWYPADLPLPAGSFATAADDGGGEGIRVVTLVVPRALEDTITTVVRGWSGEGWKMGAGEREPWEAENVFWKPDDRYGRFRILESCGPEWTFVTVAITEEDA